jgi:uncharacterized protein (TIRG00374 family)
MTAWLRKLLPFILGCLLLFYALRGVTFKSLLQEFKHVSVELVLALVVSLLIYTILRAFRWRLLLQPLGYKPDLVSLSVALQSAYIGSMILPGGGEITRCLTLQRTDGVPLSQSVGLVVAERVIDLAAMGLLFVVTFSLELKRMQDYMADLPFLFQGNIILWGAGAALVVGLAGFAFWKWWGVTRRKQSTFVSRLSQLIRGLWEGFIAIRHLKSPLLFVLLTLLMQFVAWVTMYVLLLSLGTTQSLPPTAALTVLAVAALGGLAVPTQGGIGTFHFLVSRALVLYGLSTAEGAIAATFMHGVTFIINIAFSGACFLIIPSLVQQRQEKLRAEQASERKL